jgi:hypothetical protein
VSKRFSFWLCMTPFYTCFSFISMSVRFNLFKFKRSIDRVEVAEVEKKDSHGGIARLVRTMHANRCDQI